MEAVLSKEEALRRFMARKAARAAAPPMTVTEQPAAAKQEIPGQDLATPCRFGLRCTITNCVYAHPNMAGTPCRFGLNCTRTGCAYAHPVNACRFGVYCTRPDCVYAHPNGVSKVIPPCRFGSRCSTVGCLFAHEEQPEEETSGNKRKRNDRHDDAPVRRKRYKVKRHSRHRKLIAGVARGVTEESVLAALGSSFGGIKRLCNDLRAQLSDKDRRKLPKKRTYPHAAVHYIPKDFVIPILETLQMKGLACSRGDPQGPKRFLWRKTATAEDVAETTPALSSAGGP